MAKVEIDESELTVLQRGMTLLNNLNKNSDARRHLETAIKVVDPSQETEEDIANRYAAPIRKDLDEIRAENKALRESLEAERKSIKEREETAAFESAFGRIRNNYSDDALDKIKTIMVDRKIADPEAAALLYDKQNPPPPRIETSSYEPDFYDMAPPESTLEDTKFLFQNPDAWEDRKIDQVLREERQRARAA